VSSLDGINGARPANPIVEIAAGCSQATTLTMSKDGFETLISVLALAFAFTYPLTPIVLISLASSRLLCQVS
jgi:hypothetical protein